MSHANGLSTLVSSAMMFVLSRSNSSVLLLQVLVQKGQGMFPGILGVFGRRRLKIEPMTGVIVDFNLVRPLILREQPVQIGGKIDRHYLVLLPVYYQHRRHRARSRLKFTRQPSVVLDHRLHFIRPKCGKSQREVSAQREAKQRDSIGLNRWIVAQTLKPETDLDHPGREVLSHCSICRGSTAPVWL